LVYLRHVHARVHDVLSVYQKTYHLLFSSTFFNINLVDDSGEIGITKANRYFFPRRINLLVGKGEMPPSIMTSIEEGESHTIKVDEILPCKRCRFLKSENVNSRKKKENVLYQVRCY